MSIIINQVKVQKYILIYCVCTKITLKLSIGKNRGKCLSLTWLWSFWGFVTKHIGVTFLFGLNACKVFVLSSHRGFSRSISHSTHPPASLPSQALITSTEADSVFSLRRGRWNISSLRNVCLLRRKSLWLFFGSSLVVLLFFQCPGRFLFFGLNYLTLAGFSSLTCMCKVLWTASVLDWQKPFPHSWHLKGFSLEWMYLRGETQQVIAFVSTAAVKWTPSPSVTLLLSSAISFGT